VERGSDGGGGSVEQFWGFLLPFNRRIPSPGGVSGNEGSSQVKKINSKESLGEDGLSTLISEEGKKEKKLRNLFHRGQATQMTKAIR